ncbi:RyR domain-containing protein [Kocuria rhizosphaericola]|uniref:RyR domain-containing protein n=1 Tax=Kocuria rhizosphaericola TaxID=3376284 RepID=UPI003791CAA2
MQRAISLVATFVVAAVAAFLGMISYAACANDGVAFFTQVWWTLSLFVGSTPDQEVWSGIGDCPSDPSLAHQLARILALGVTYAGLVGVLATIWWHQLGRLAARLSRTRILVLGLDANSVALLPSLASGLRPGTRLIVMDRTEDPEVSSAARAVGATILHADGSEHSLMEDMLVRRLARGRKLRAVDVYLLSDDTIHNLQVVQSIHDIVGGREIPGTEVPRLVVRIDDPWSAEAWRRAHIGEDTPWLSDALSCYETTARMILGHEALRELRRLIIVGASPMGLALLSAAAQQARERRMLNHADVGVPEVITLVGPDADQLAQDFTLAQARFSVTADMRTLKAESLEEVLATGSHRTTGVILTDPPGGGSFPVGPRLAAAHPELRVLGWADGVRGVSRQPIMNQYYPFNPGLVDADYAPFALQPENLDVVPPEDTWIRIASLMHEEYVQSLDSSGDRPSHASWMKLPPFYRLSNVRQLKEILKGMHALGRTWKSPTESGPWPTELWWENEIEWLSEAEHASWLAFYSAHGWRAVPETDDERRRHKDMVPWEQLGVESQRYTRTLVTRSLALLRSLGYQPAVQVRRYRRSGTVSAIQRKQPWTWRTEDGQVMEAATGDWLVTGADGREWSVASQVFADCYRPLTPGRYERIGIVEARPALPNDVATSFESAHHQSVAGQWLVRGAAGETWLVGADDFATHYSPVLSI